MISRENSREEGTGLCRGATSSLESKRRAESCMKEGVAYRSFHEGGTDMFSRLGGVWWVGDKKREKFAQVDLLQFTLLCFVSSTLV